MSSPSLLEELLADQRSLTAVEKFSRAHDALAPGAQRYRDLIPLEKPQAGEQYAFEVALDKCSGCKACVTACHSLNGLDDNETWREVGLLIAEPKRHGWHGRINAELGTGSAEHFDSAPPACSALPAPSSALQHVTTACHHCVDPACLNGCPVLAYEKDPVTGIVRHLDDQCIGCQYCVLKCPYDVPKYNARLGIVRKCDMCSSRLAVGEAPACVQACPNEAIRITKVSTHEVSIQFRERNKDFLTHAPDGAYTLPTTIYRSADSHVRANFTHAEHADSAVRAPQLVAADSAELKVQPAHWPLVVMLVLSQASVGVITVAVLLKLVSVPVLLASLALVVVGLGASTFHLGRPFGAWRAFLNLRRSWMSREIVVFGMFPPLLTLACALTMAPVAGWLSPSPLNGERAGVRGDVALRAPSQNQTGGVPTPHPNPLPVEGRGNQNGLLSLASTAAAFIGLLGVFCSAMIYHDTHRPLWHWHRSVSFFLGTTAILGAAGVAIVQSSPALPFIMIVAVLLKLGGEISILRHGTNHDLTPLKKTVLLVTGKFQPLAMIRLVCALVGGLCLPLFLTIPSTPAPKLIAVAAFTLLLAGELLERFLFFTTVTAPKMPGGLPT
jgi:formate dehydrogenase iron-sulfur subunit